MLIDKIHPMLPHIQVSKDLTLAPLPLCTHLSTRHPLLEISSPINLSLLAIGIVGAGVKPFCFLESARAPDLCPHFPRAGAGPADGSAAGFCTHAGVQGSFLPKPHFENKPQQLHSASPDPRTFQWSGPHPCPWQGRRDPCGDPLLMAEGGRRGLQAAQVLLNKLADPSDTCPLSTGHGSCFKEAGWEQTHVVRTHVGRAGCCLHWLCLPRFLQGVVCGLGRSVVSSSLRPYGL